MEIGGFKVVYFFFSLETRGRERCYLGLGEDMFECASTLGRKEK